MHLLELRKAIVYSYSDEISVAPAVVNDHGKPRGLEHSARVLLHVDEFFCYQVDYQRMLTILIIQCVCSWALAINSASKVWNQLCNTIC